MKFILGKKLNMTQIWTKNDQVMAVTPVLAGPCVITQVKTKKKDGYEALQLAFGERKAKNLNKPQAVKFKALGISPMHVREFRLEDASKFAAGQIVAAETFAVGDKIDVVGTSKGKGFQGVVKRHGFHGFRATHGNKDQERMPGSAGPKGPAHVFKGTRMGGRMGGDRVTVSNLEVMAVDLEKNLIYVKGAIPGAVNGLVMIKGEGELQIKTDAAPIEVEKAEVAEVAAEASEVPAEQAVEAPTETPAAEEAAPASEEVKA